MNKMVMYGENYVIARKREFVPHSVSHETLKAVVDFAYEMCFGKGHHRAYRTGGSLVRHAGEKFCNTFQGKLAEVCLRRALIDAGLECAEPNFDIYGEGVWDDTDLIVNGRTLSVKSASYFSNLLLLESRDYDAEGNYIPNLNAGGTASYDFYVLVRISPDIKGLFKGRRLMYSDSISRETIDEIIGHEQWSYDIAGWISHDEFREAIAGRFVIPRNAVLNGSIRMDATNYYVQAGDMSDFASLCSSLSHSV